MQNNQQLNEGLRPDDLTELVYPIFEVDSFRSKMGEDQDVCVVSFKVTDRAPAKDLMEFIEKGYEFDLMQMLAQAKITVVNTLYLWKLAEALS